MQNDFSEHLSVLKGRRLRTRAEKSTIILTVQREHGVKDLALHLPRALRGAAHPQPLVETHGCNDGVASVRRLLPLGQRGGRNDADPAAQSQEVAQ